MDEGAPFVQALGAVRPDTAEERTLLITGASSFTGHALSLAAAHSGWRVIAPLTGPRQSYTGVRAARVARLEVEPNIVLLTEARVGSSGLCEAIRATMRSPDSGGRIDAVALHHAVVGDFRSPDYDVGYAVSDATRGARDLVALAAAYGARGVVITRSVFESGQGCTNDPRPITLYAIAKTASSQVWSEEARLAGLAIQHFTITNPVGPFEEPRFIAYLARCWQRRETPVLQSPQYIRDNVAIPVLAEAHLAAVAAASLGQGGHRTPSMWVGSNLDFAQRTAREFGQRWSLRCPVDAAQVPVADEPQIRVGIDPVGFIDGAAESRFWDDFAAFYRPNGLFE